MGYGRFHVDKMSSAHVYLRLNKGQTIDDISEVLLEDCAQLVKANSIQGKSYMVSILALCFFYLFILANNLHVMVISQWTLR